MDCVYNQIKIEPTHVVVECRRDFKHENFRPQAIANAEVPADSGLTVKEAKQESPAMIEIEERLKEREAIAQEPEQAPEALRLAVPPGSQDVLMESPPPEPEQMY